MSLLDPNRFSRRQNISRLHEKLYSEIKHLPIISPQVIVTQNGLLKIKGFPDPSQLFVVPDHYVYRLLVSHGIKLSSYVNFVDQDKFEADPRNMENV